MRTKLDVLLLTDLNPQECLRRLQEASDPGKRTLFSLSGYKGSKPVLAKIEGSEIKLWKRRYYRNDFAPYFFGTLSPAERSTRIEGHFDMDRWVRIFMTIWLGFAIIGGAAAIIATVSHPIHGRCWDRRDRAAGSCALRDSSSEVRALDREGRGGFPEGISRANSRGEAGQPPDLFILRKDNRKHAVVAARTQAARSKIPAAPMPPPTHIVTNP